MSVVFYGDHIWAPQFGEWFTRFLDWPSFDLNDLDTLDANTSAEVLRELDEGSDFDIMVLHMIGVDNAGHTFGSFHPEITRKLKDIEGFL